MRPRWARCLPLVMYLLLVVAAVVVAGVLLQLVLVAVVALVVLQQVLVKRLVAAARLHRHCRRRPELVASWPSSLPSDVEVPVVPTPAVMTKMIPMTGRGRHWPVMGSRSSNGFGQLGAMSRSIQSPASKVVSEPRQDDWAMVVLHSRGLGPAWGRPGRPRRRCRRRTPQRRSPNIHDDLQEVVLDRQALEVQKLREKSAVSKTMTPKS